MRYNAADADKCLVSAIRSWQPFTAVQRKAAFFYFSLGISLGADSESALSLLVAGLNVVLKADFSVFIEECTVLHSTTE